MRMFLFNSRKGKGKSFCCCCCSCSGGSGWLMELSLSSSPNQVKVTSDEELLVYACEQFLGKTVDDIRSVVLQTLEGHLRSILGMLPYCRPVMGKMDSLVTCNRVSPIPNQLVLPVQFIQVIAWLNDYLVEMDRSNQVI